MITQLVRYRKEVSKEIMDFLIDFLFSLIEDNDSVEIKIAAIESLGACYQKNNNTVINSDDGSTLYEIILDENTDEARMVSIT